MKQAFSTLFYLYIKVNLWSFKYMQLILCIKDKCTVPFNSWFLESLKQSPCIVALKVVRSTCWPPQTLVNGRICHNWLIQGICLTRWALICVGSLSCYLSNNVKIKLSSILPRDLAYCDLFFVNEEKEYMKTHNHVWHLVLSCYWMVLWAHTDDQMAHCEPSQNHRNVVVHIRSHIFLQCCRVMLFLRRRVKINSWWRTSAKAL